MHLDKNWFIFFSLSNPSMYWSHDLNEASHGGNLGGGLRILVSAVSPFFTIKIKDIRVLTCMQLLWIVCYKSTSKLSFPRNWEGIHSNRINQMKTFRVGYMVINPKIWSNHVEAIPCKCIGWSPKPSNKFSKTISTASL